LGERLIAHPPTSGKQSTAMEEQYTISLNSFVRRTQNTHLLKELFLKSGATLTRQGRSRHWQLTLTRDQARTLCRAIEHSDQPSWLWCSKLLIATKPQVTQGDLSAVARAHWPITVNQLVAMTDCTLAQARRIIDEIEWE